MTDAHQELLERLEEESLKKQNKFIQAISHKLNRPRVTAKPNQPFRGAPDFWKEYQLPLPERVERFIANFRAVGGHADHFRDINEVKSFIVNKANEMSARHIIRQHQDELAALNLELSLPDAKVEVWNSADSVNWKAVAAQSDFGVVLADYAAAYTGSITVVSDQTKGRSVSLLPTVLFALIPVERLKTRLGEILIDFDQVNRSDLPAGIHFISGPSRSADIENDLTIGVHGPGVVYALIYGSLE